jgi:multisubunit Na+/H+ antiporter MnhC subunit
MDLPFGQGLVVVAGLAVAAIGGYHIYKGWTERFRSDLASTPSHMTVIAGKLGYIARGVALIFVGLGVLTAGVTHQASKSKGLDGALHQMVTLPLGQVLVAVVAAGFACFGVYLFSRARRART